MSNGKAPARPSLTEPIAFADAYRTHSKAILVFLTRRTYDPETALDLTAETFARAYAGRRRYRGTTDDELAAWLFAIARNVLARFLRRGVAERRALTRLGIEVPSLEPDDLVRVARRLDVSEPTARARVSRALRALAGALDHRPITQETSA